jgi:uncharacterized protein (TIGR03083 family)
MEIARLYREAQRSFLELVVTFDDDDWATVVPCCPGWTARDVLSHAVGVTLDIAEGNIEGAATDPWTAAQVERWRDSPVDELLVRWREAIDLVAEALETFGEVRPPIDCHTHEHDLRQALGRPGNRDSELMRTAATLFGARPIGRRVEMYFDDGTVVTVPGGAATVSLTGVSPFEMTRSRLGRRTPDQVRSWAWSEPLTDGELAAWFVFGPAEAPIDE